MAEVNWSQLALADLSEVAAYIAEQSRSEASAVVRSAVERAEERGEFPESGSITPELNDPQIREVLVKNTFRLIYEVIDDRIFVVAFVRSARRISSGFLKD